LQSLLYRARSPRKGHRATLPSDGVAGRSEAYLNAAMRYRGVVIAPQRFGNIAVHGSSSSVARV